MIKGNIKKLQNVLGITLAGCMCFGIVGNCIISYGADSSAASEFASTETAADSDTPDASETEDTASDDASGTERLTTNYTHVSTTYTKADYTGSDVVINIEESLSEGTDFLTSESRDYSNQVAAIEHGDEIALTVDVPADGLYWLSFDYLSYDESILPIELSFAIDGEYPFYEARSLNFETTWVQEGDADVDRYGNEIVALPDKLIRWESKYLGDASYRYSTPLKLELTAGTHEFEIVVKEGTLLLGNLTLTAPQTVTEYTGSEKAEGSELIIIEAEDFAERNDSSIHAAYEFDNSKRKSSQYY